MNPFEKYLNETMNMLNERSINKIQADFSEVVNKMSAMAKEFAVAEGDEKANILAELKGLTAKKNDLIKEIDAAVAGKDRDVQLAIKEKMEEAYGSSNPFAKPAGLSKEETMVVAQKFADAMSKADKVKVTVNKRTLEEDSFDLDVNGEEFDGGSYNIFRNGNVMNMALPNNPIYGQKNDSVDTIAKNMKTFSTNESKLTVKRQYTENHPAVTVGKAAKIRNKVLEAIKDGKIPQEKFDKIVSELSNDSKRWTKNNARYFTVSEDGVSLSDFGQRILKGITVNEKTEKNPEIWVPGQFDKEIAKHPNNKITRELVLKAAEKWDVDPSEAIPYVEFGWGIDLSENKNTNMKTKFIYESFSESVNSLKESKEAAEAEAILNDLLDERGGDMEELHGMSMEDALDTVSTYGHSGSKAKKIAQELVSMCNESVINEAFASAKLASLLTGANAMPADLPKAFYNMSRLALDKIQDVDIIEMDPETAKKEKRANAVYMYFTTNEKENPYASDSYYSKIPANTLLAITNGNNEWMNAEWGRYSGRQDRSLRVTKRDDSAGIAKSGASASFGTRISSMKQVAELADRAYCMDLDILKARYSTADQRIERANAKKDATALMDPKSFKNANKERYNAILAQKASSLPLDSVVLDAIDTLSNQIKDALAKAEKGSYGELIMGHNPKGREVKLSDASNLMRNILDDYQRYVGDVVQAENEKAAGYTGSYYEGSMKQRAKSIMDNVKKIENKNYAW
jgi:hypothetical protein